MKKLILAILLILPLAASAQKHTITASAGSPSIMSGIVGFFSGLGNGIDGKEIHYTGAYSLHYGYNVLDWLRVGPYLSGESIWTDEAHLTFLQALARVDFTYFTREHVRLYSGVSLGLMMAYSGYDEEQPWQARVGYSATVFGVEAGGKHVFGFVDLSAGTTEIIRGGIGVKF